MPSICDPGEDLVKRTKSKGFNIICIPGPCAATTAIVSSGLPSSKFVFEGFLPKKKSDRENILLAIRKRDKTTIIFESPHRLKSLLNELRESLGGERCIQISRELTKKFEEHIGETVDEVIAFFEDKEVLGEITIVIKGENKKNQTTKIDNYELRKELLDLIDAGLSLAKASKYLAKKNNLTKRTIYNLY